MLAGAIAGLAAMLALIRSFPGTKAAAISETPPPRPVNYQSFFAPSAGPSPVDSLPSAAPHTRTRAS